MKQVIWIILIELLAMLDYPIKAYLESMASKTYDMTAYMTYSVLAYIVFGMLLCGVKQCVDGAPKKVSVLLLVLNIVLTAVHYLVFNSYFSALLLILLGFCVVAMIRRLSRNR